MPDTLSLGADSWGRNEWNISRAQITFHDKEITTRLLKGWFVNNVKRSQPPLGRTSANDQAIYCPIVVKQYDQFVRARSSENWLGFYLIELSVAIVRTSGDQS